VILGGTNVAEMLEEDETILEDRKKL